MSRIQIIRMNIEMQLDFSFFKNIFGKKSGSQEMQHAVLFSGVPYFTNNSGDIYDISLARACIHAIASHCAKLQPKYLINNEYQDKTQLQYILGTRPNPYMSTFDFIYKTVSMLYTSNNVFVFCHSDRNGNIDGLYPIPYKNFELLEAGGKFFGRFQCNNSTPFVLPYEEIIHLRRHFNDNDFMGSSQLKVLKPTKKLSDSVVESIVNGVQNSNRLQGLLKATSIVQDEELDAMKNKFVHSYMDISNSSGVAILDKKLDFQQINLEPVLINKEHMDAVSNDMFRYYGISENIVQNNYSETEYESFYNGIVETFAIQFSQELTSKILTNAEIKSGAKIILSAERMGFASMDTRVKAIQTLMPLGILSINESRKIMEMDDIKDGDRHLVSLNFVDLDKANKYQVGEGDNDTEK